MDYKPSPPIRIVGLFDFGAYIKSRRERLLLSANTTCRHSLQLVDPQQLSRIEQGRFSTVAEKSDILKGLGYALGLRIETDTAIGDRPVFLVRETATTDYLQFLVREYCRAELEAARSLFSDEPDTTQQDKLQATAQHREKFTTTLIRALYAPINTTPRIG